jgi:NTP pyrophosphatase (non-canonical NTP hydrolase)
MNFNKLVTEELKRARKMHGPVNSIHEGYAVILEELDEVWDEVKKKTKERDLNHLFKELIQVSAMAQKMAEDVVIPHMKSHEISNKK